MKNKDKTVIFNWFSKRYYLLFTLYFFISLSIVLLYFFDPAIHSHIYPPSLTREIGGFYCAGCGTLRALHQILRGNIDVAFWLNPLLFLILPYLIYWFIAYNLDFFLKFKLPTIHWQNKQIIYLTVIGFAYTILRNIDLAVLDFLRP